MSEPAITVVSSTWNRSDRCRRLVRALADQTLDPGTFEVIIVDNGSSDDTSSMLEAMVPTLPYRLIPLRVEVNRGPAGARNLGWHQARSAVVAYTDDDCVPDPSWLAQGLAAMASDADLGVVQGRTRAPEGTDLDSPSRWAHRQVIDGPTAQFEACNVFYRREALEVTGGFDEAIGWWGEDASAGWSVVEAGWARGFAAQAVVTHDVTARGLRWNLRQGLLEGNLVGLAGRFPGFRAQAFWRPWAFRPDDAEFVLAVVSTIAALRWRPAALAAAPYLYRRRPPDLTPRGLCLSAEAMAVDAARAAGQISGAIRHRVAVL